MFCGAECYAICEKGKDKAIGAIELKLNGHTDMTNCDEECELGYWLGKPFWGRGYMSEAAREIIRHGFEELGMKKNMVRILQRKLKIKTCAGKSRIRLSSHLRKRTSPADE